MNLLLAAIMFIESGNDPNAVGDHGHAIGAYQIHSTYFYDGLQQLLVEQGCSKAHARRMALRVIQEGRWKRLCRRPEFAGRIVAAYLRRYCPEAVIKGDWRVMAMVHHGGPTAGDRPTPADVGYAERVLARASL